MSEESEFIKGWYIIINNDDLYIRYLESNNSLQKNESILSSSYETFDEAEQVLKYIEENKDARNENVLSIGDPVILTVLCLHHLVVEAYVLIIVIMDHG
jgi:hypothetical protein